MRFMQTLKANLQSTKESALETKFMLLLDKPAGIKQFFNNLSVRKIFINDPDAIQLTYIRYS